MDEKKELRKTMLRAREALPEEYTARASAAIQEKTLALPQYQRAKSVFLYISMPKEPATLDILKTALAEGKRVYVPKCQGRSEMLAVRIKDLSGLLPGAYGIPEPVECAETITADKLDLTLVPCVCASKDGKRLGHGGGYYDRFLAGHAENAFCLCFERMLRDDIPMGDKDVFLPCVITENGVFVHRRSAPDTVLSYELLAAID